MRVTLQNKPGDALRAPAHFKKMRSNTCAKTDQGGLYGARTRVRPGPDLPALIALRSNDQRPTRSRKPSGHAGLLANCWH